MVPHEHEGASVVGLDAVLDQAADARVHLLAHHWKIAAVAPPAPTPAPAPPAALAPTLSAASSKQQAVSSI